MDNIIELSPLNTTPEAQSSTTKYDAGGEFTEEKVQTSFGLLSVEVVGDRRKPAILTYHDIGLNGNSCFQGFLGFSEMAMVADHFCIYHVNAPGQEDDADPVEPESSYPSMDDLAHMLVSVVEYFKLKSFVGFGIGMGANILCRYALKHQKIVDALILVNCNVTYAGWMEWGYQKVNISYLRSRGMTTFTVDYLMWHHFGRHLHSVNQDMLESYRSYFSNLTKPHNLAAVMESWTARTPIDMSREGTTVTCPVLQLVGQDSSHMQDTIDTNVRLKPQNAEWMKVADACGMVLEDQPGKCTEAIILFLQGQGYFPTLSHTRWVAQRAKEQREAQQPESKMVSGDSHDNTGGM